MRIAIVGAGIAGLAAAWLLDGDHEVVLFERNDFLGGHARTVHFEYQGKRAYANPAFGYIAVTMYPHFIRLLEYLDVKRVEAPASFTVFSKPQHKSVFVTPTLSPLRLAPIFHLDQLINLIRLQRFLSAARVLDERDDWQTPLETFIESQPGSAFLKTQVLYPWLAAVSGVTIADVKTFSARAALKYPVHIQPESVLRPFSLEELDGGVASYIEPLVRTLKTTQIRKGVDLHFAGKTDSHFVLQEANGDQHTFDHVIIAAPAHEAAKLVSTLPGSDRLHSILSRFPYIQTRIMVHSDRRFMPAQRKDWSVYNAMSDGPHCEATIWCQHSGEFDYFKSWVTFVTETPEHVHAEFAFHHPRMTPDYFRAQSELATLQGQENLWFAGSYLQDVDSHENGILSAMAIAQRLNPASANLKRLI